MTFTDWTALIGALIAVAAFVLSVVNYLGDRPKVVVSLKWDMALLHDPRYDANKRWAIVRVANAGRQPIFLSHASLKLPKGHDSTHLILAEGLAGKRLGEGDAPYSVIGNQDDLAKYAKDWHKIRAVVFDLRNKEYISPRPDKSRPPSWAKGGAKPIT